MSLFNLRSQFATGGATYNPFENPAVPLSSVALDNMFGSAGANDSGQQVTIDSALSVPTVYRCVSLISGLIAGCPLEVFKNPGKKLITVPALDPLNADTMYTQYELWELVMAHLLLYGNAYVLKVKNGLDRVVDLRPIWPGRVTPKMVKGSKIFLVKKMTVDGALSPGEPDVYTTDQLMHVPGLGYDGLAGMSPIMLMKQAVGTALAGDRLAARFYANGTQLAGILKTAVPLTSESQADELKRKWAIKNSGIGNAGQVAVLDAETEFQPLTLAPDELQFIEARRWETTEIARMYGIPPHLVGDVEKSTSWGTGIEEQNTAFVAYTLAAWANRIEQRVTREVVQVRGQSATFDFSTLLRGDMTERFTAYATAIQWGFLTRNEARIREDWEPIEGLDEPLTPLNMVAGKVKIDPATGQPMAVPGNDLDGPLTTTVKPGSGKNQALDESNE
jgi:HK97 family phage portal protein